MEDPADRVLHGNPIATLGLAAFAISAYIRTVLCPSLATVESSESSTLSLAGTLLAPGNRTGAGERSALPSIASDGHRQTPSFGSVDSDLLRQLDQVSIYPCITISCGEVSNNPIRCASPLEIT